MISTTFLKEEKITFQHREETCALDTGEMCQFYTNKNFGTRHRCALFDTPLFRHSYGPFKGYVARCHQCTKEFGK